jgi:hypothetical protein
MEESKMISIKKSIKHLTTNSARYMQISVLLAAPLLLSACAMEFINAKPAREIKPPPPLEGNLYAGWRVFQDKCASCHSSAATGGDRAPDLLPIVRDMNSRHFAELVLKRYDLGYGLGKSSSDQSTVDTRIEDIVRLKEPPIEMPAWQGEPAVNAHVLDLYTYLIARSDGRLAAGRPPR